MTFMHVLIIDDNTLHLKMCRILLEKMNHTVMTEESLDSLKKHTDGMTEPDIALVDFRLQPGVTGVDALQFLKQNTKWAKTKYLALTADVGERSYLDGSGFDDVVFKPVTESLLSDILRKYE